MNILVINGSPSGENSITLQTVNYIGKFFPQHSFEVIDAGRKIRSIEKDFEPCAEALRKAELIIFCYPVYTFLVPAQLHRFIELIKESGIDLSGKPATQITTSKHFYDVTAHRFIQDNCDDLGLNYVRGLSADMDDLLTKKGQKEALDFFKFLMWSVENGCYEPKLYEAGAFRKAPEAGCNECGAEAETAEPEVSFKADPAAKAKRGTVALVADGLEADPCLKAMTGAFIRSCGMNVKVIDIADFPFAGGCLGCFNCAADGKCVYKDGFDGLLREGIQTADATVYAFRIKDHSMGYRFKLFDDRQFCNGHRTVTMGKPVGYLIDGSLEREPNVRMLLESRAQVGGNFLAGLACSSGPACAEDCGKQIESLAKTLEFAVREDYQQPQNFYGVGGLKIFRDLIYQMQGLMREDHRFYKEHGFYDFPQKKKGRIAAMYLVGGMMDNKKLKKKIGGRMTEGMMMPYKKLLDSIDKK